MCTSTEQAQGKGGEGEAKKVNSGHPIPEAGVVHKGYKGDGPQGWFSSLVAQTTLALYIGWTYILLLLFIGCFFSGWIRLITLALWSTVLLPAQLYWPEVFDAYIFETWRKYAEFTYLFEEVKTDKDYVFAEYPHGVFPLGPLLAGTLIPRMFPSHVVYSIGASVLFRIPLYKHVSTWMGTQPATKKNFLKLLQKGSVAVVAGGIAEMFMQDRNKEVIMLRKRKGFIKVALEAGKDIVPVYHFGNSQVLDFGPRSLMGISRSMKMSLGVVYGKWGLPCWPKRHRVRMVAGKAVRVERAMSPSEEGFDAEVERLHAEVVAAYEGLYQRNKDAFGWADRPLEIR